ncbi:hypothetical protein [Streptomyces sp. NPDC093594]|uniref:hypothetical protein n=1 Tax=Streptomyces sp. NPDC093594 TaxID=3155305 RepID=UPI00344D2CD3
MIALGVAVAFAMTSLVGEVLATTQQQLFPEKILTRVSSLDMISLIAMPVGYAAAAPVAEFLGTRTALLVAAALIGTPCLLMNLAPGVRSVQRFPDGTIGIAGRRDSAVSLPRALPASSPTVTEQDASNSRGKTESKLRLDIRLPKGGRLSCQAWVRDDGGLSGLSYSPRWLWAST